MFAEAVGEELVVVDIFLTDKSLGGKFAGDVQIDVRTHGRRRSDLDRTPRTLRGKSLFAPSYIASWTAPLRHAALP